VIIQVKEIAFIYYQVTDIARARRFYEELLGLTVGVEYEVAPALVGIASNAAMTR
jgi:hypothetical protein